MGSTFAMTCVEGPLMEDVRHCANVLGFNTSIQRYKLKKPHHNPTLTRIGFQIGKNHTYKWLEKHSLRGKNSYTKRVPQVIMEGDFNTVINFIGAYWSCDGYIGGKGKNRKKDSRKDILVSLASVSKELLEDVRHLLIRLGINSRVRRKVRKNYPTKRQGETYTSYTLELRSQNDVSRFIQKIPRCTEKIQHICSYNINRTEFDNSILPDEIVSIEKNGLEDCYCLEVEEDHTFTADDIIVHNTNIVSVMLVAWVWATKPWVKFLYASYAQKISWEHSRLCRLLIESDWYQSRWGHIVQLCKNQATKGHFVNTAHGHRIATSAGAGGTALGGDILILDDINDARQGVGESQVVREGTNDWISRVWTTRLNPGPTNCYIAIQQRIAEMDQSGYWMKLYPNKELVKLILPMEFESSRRAKTIVLPSTNGKVWEDPRTQEGELLCEAYMDRKFIDFKKTVLGSYNYAGQFQQRPAPAEGGIIQRSWFRVWTDKIPTIQYLLQSWDTALTDTKHSAYSACTTWGCFRDNAGVLNVMLISAWRGRVPYPELLRRAARLRRNCSDIYTEEIPPNKSLQPDITLIEAKASGHPLISDLNTKGIIVHGFNPDKYGDKTQRVHLVTPFIECGRIWVMSSDLKDHKRLRADHEMLVENAILFPNAESRDLVDSMTQAVLYLSNVKGMLTHVMNYQWQREGLPAENMPGYVEERKR